MKITDRLPLDVINLIVSFLAFEEDLYMLQFTQDLTPCYRLNWKADFFMSLAALQHVRYLYPLYASLPTQINNRALYTQSKQYYETVIASRSRVFKSLPQNGIRK